MLQVIVLYCELVNIYALSLTEQRFNWTVRIRVVEILETSKIKMSSGNCGATCLVVLLRYVKNSSQKNWNKSDTNRKKNPLTMSALVLSCSCATNEALMASPKNPTSERTSSFFSKSLRFARGNLFALFEWQTLYVCHSMVSAKNMLGSFSLKFGLPSSSGITNVGGPVLALTDKKCIGVVMVLCSTSLLT